MFYALHIIVFLQFFSGFKLGALPSNGTICAHKEKLHSIIIGGIREPGHWLYPSVDKVYGIEDKHVLIINDLAMTNPDVQAGVNNAALPILEKALACLKGRISQIIFEHVGYGLQEKNFNSVMPFLTSLLKPGGKIVYTSYRVPFSRSHSQSRQRQEYRPIVPNFCQLLGVPEPKIIYEFPPHHLTPKGFRLESELSALNHRVCQKVQMLLENDSCCDVENDPEILRLMKKVQTVLNNPYFPTPIKPWWPIESYSALHAKILNCSSDLPHQSTTCDITQKWWPFRMKKSPCSETFMVFKSAGLVTQSVSVERTDHVFAFKIIAQKPDSRITPKKTDE